jgi:signal transduction histidine kinase/CheY-like chemotaxis protein
MYQSLAVEYTSYIFPVFVIVHVTPANSFVTSAVITVINLSFLLPALLAVALYYIWCLRRQITRINRTGKEQKEARLNMIHNISQEVRTPLNAIVGFSEQLSYTALNNNQRELLSNIETAATVLMHTQRNIQELAWALEGQLHLATYPFSPYKTFTTVTDQMSARFHDKQLTFEAVYEGERQLQVTGDEHRLERILVCLLENALKYTDTGSVHCHTRVDRQNAGEVSLHVRVSDTGRGIAEEKLPLIFEQYAHDGGAAGSLHGAGIGLALVKALLDLHRGEIQVESAPGKGSTFTCHIRYQVLPLPQTMIISQEEVDDMTGNCMKGRYVLVADDQEMNLALMEKILTRWQCRFDKAPDGAAAYELFVNNKYDIVLLDLQMPRMTGIEVVRRIRADEVPEKAHMLVLALTADATLPGNPEFLNAGFDDYLLKPFREKEIYNVIIRHLRPESNFINAEQ